MPVYEYRCTSCGERTEAQQHVGDPPLSKCPRCDGVLKRVVSAPALQFKGSGWYVTDYARRGESGASGKDETSGAAKPEATSAKPESASAKPESASAKPESASAKREGASADKGTKKENTTKAG